MAGRVGIASTGFGALTVARILALTRLRFPRSAARVDTSTPFVARVVVRPHLGWRLAARLGPSWARRRLRARVDELRSDVDLERPAFLRVTVHVDLD